MVVYVDKTPLFIELLKGSLNREQKEQLLFTKKESISSPFIIAAVEIGDKIAEYHQNLLSIKSQYCQKEKIKGEKLDAQQRALVDEKTAVFITNIMVKIEELKKRAGEEEKKQQKFNHFSSILWYLQWKLSFISSLIEQFKSESKRLEAERNKLLKPNKSLSFTEYENTPEDADDIKLSSSERLLLDNENKELIMEFTNTMDELEITAGKIEEISQLHQILSTNIQMQAEAIDQIYDDSIYSADNIIQGNKYLTKAKESNSSFQLKKSLYAMCSQYGQIIDIVAMKTPKMRGQAFVVFKDVASATNAVRCMQNFPFYDKQIKVQYAKSKSLATRNFEEMMGVSQSVKIADQKPNVNARGEEIEDDAMQIDADEDGNTPASSLNSEIEPNRILFLENFPPKSSLSMLNVLFQQYPGFREVRLVPGRDGIAFVEFENVTQALMAQSVLNNFRLDSSHMLKITFAKK